MWFISPFVPIFFRPTDDRYGVKSKYIQKFAPTDNILLEVICDNLDSPPVLKLNNIRTGNSSERTWKSWIMNESRVLYYYTFSGLECDIYNIEIGGFKCEPFEIITDEKELGKSTLIKYTMRNNRMRLDGVFWIDGVQHTFEFRVPGGFKDDDRIFSVDNEQFVTPYGNVVEMYGMDSVQRVFTLGNEIGCPIWFAELLNRILCCTHVYFEGVQYARKDSSIPEKTQLIAGMKSYVFKQNLQEVKDDLSVTFGEEGGGSTGGGSESGEGGAGVDILRLIDDDRTPSDKNVFSALRSIYEIKFYCEYYGKEYEKKFLRKDKADGTPFPFTFGDYVKFGEFLTGISGGYIGKNGDMEMDSGVFRKRLFVPEIAYNRTTYFKGRMVNSPGGGCTVKEWTDNGNGSYTVVPELTDADGLSQFVDDILTTYFTARNAGGRLQAFEEMKFRVTAVDYDTKTFVMVPKPGTAWKPGDSMVLAQTGNFTNSERQTYILIDSVNGNNCITFYDNANTWDPEPAQEKSWFGKKKGRTVHGIPADNYSAVLRNIIMSGKIFQVDDITGEAFRVPLFKGAWQSGTKYAYYDEVTHNGSSWMCVNSVGTTSEPSDSNTDWLKYVSKGDIGMTGAQGIPGIPGKDGKILYTWIRYADDANGSGISNNPAGKKFLGMAYNKESAMESNNPKDYQWSNIKGEDGIGVPGADGKTYYTWVAYSDKADGTGMYQQPNDNTRYIGIAINKDTAVESNNPADYTWSKFRGDDGKDGKDGTSITNCGAWHTGMHVPYMGLVRMAERVFLCMNPAGTSNPPMWTITDKDGNRLLQTQDGGRTYGYILTGELNTAEYELLVENGKDGRDGTDHEWIFKHTTDNVAPTTPGTSQVDDYVPEGWHDDAMGVSESLPYEWACSRTKKDGVWSAFTPAALWAKFGFDGESVILADIDNEMESVALTYEGRTTGTTVLNATVGMWYGTEKLPLKSIACATPAGVTASYNVNTGVIAMTVAGGISMPERSQVRITVTAAWQGVDYSRDLVFTIAGVRAGSPGADAVLYRLVPSVSSVSKRKDGTYSVASVSCTRTKSVDGNTAITTDGVLKYSKDGGAEVEIQNGTAISPRNFTSSLQFVYYVNGQVVDRETVPMVVDGEDGHPGSNGTSIKAGGEWRTANTPVEALTICTMGGRAWLSKVATSNPPMWTITDKDGNRLLQTQDGGRTYGYILTGELNTAEWDLVASDGMMVYLTSTVSNIRVSSAGSLVPSGFKVYAKRTLGSATLSYADGYLVARGYSNGIWSVVAGPSRSSEITVNASAGYSTFSVRCYQSQTDAAAWNDNFIAEQSVGVSYDGGRGKTGAEPRPRGLFASGNTYVWDDRFHDIVLETFNDRTIPFRVRAYGASVTVAPSSIDGDANWEPAQQFQFVATDLLLSRQIRADEIYTDDLVVQNVLVRNKNNEATCSIDGKTGEVNIKGSLSRGLVVLESGFQITPKSNIYVVKNDKALNLVYLFMGTGAAYLGTEFSIINGGSGISKIAYGMEIPFFLFKGRMYTYVKLNKPGDNLELVYSPILTSISPNTGGAAFIIRNKSDFRVNADGITLDSI